MVQDIGSLSHILRDPSDVPGFILASSSYYRHFGSETQDVNSPCVSSSLSQSYLPSLSPSLIFKSINVNYRENVLVHKIKRKNHIEFISLLI